jgi:hypothetical protein
MGKYHVDIDDSSCVLTAIIIRLLVVERLEADCANYS